MKTALVVLMFVTHVLMSYSGGWSIWLSSLGSVLIGILAWVTWPAQWKERLGLKIPWWEALLAAALAPVWMALLYAAIRAITPPQGITYLTVFAVEGFVNLSCLHLLGQTLGQEMLFGALLLYTVRQKFAKASLLLVATLAALCFSLLHSVFYRWIVMPANGGRLTLGALFVLLAIGVLRNTLILKSGHIAYAWSLHLSISLVGLAGTYISASGTELGEAAIFNSILGAPLAVAAGAVMLGACGFWLARTPQ
ncbi:MAG: hypothetical protein AB1894_15645 [Chloroflexota bacterium]